MADPWEEAQAPVSQEQGPWNDVPQNASPGDPWEQPQSISDLNKQDEAGQPWNQELDPGAGKKLPTDEEIQKIVHDEQAFDEAMSVPGIDKGAQALLGPLQMPAGAVTGAVARVSAAAEEGMYDRASPSSVLNAFLNPPVMKQYRKANGFPENVQDLLKEARKDGLYEQIIAIGNELTPKIMPHDALSEADNQLVGDLAKALFPNADAQGNDWSNAKQFLGKLAVDFYGDPLMHTTVAGKIAPEARGMAVGLDEATDAKKIIESYEARKAMGTGLGLETARGERALLQFQTPGMSRPITIKGQQFMQGLDEIGAWLESYAPIRPLMQRSGIGSFDAASSLYEMEGALQSKQVDEATAKLRFAAEPNEKINRYVSNVLEHGELEGRALSKAQGIVLSPDELEQSRNLSRVMRPLNEEGNTTLVEAGGRDLNAVRRVKPSPEEQKRRLQALTKRYGDIPTLLVRDGDITYDLTFSGSGYDLGRRLSEDSAKARRAQEALDEFHQVTASQGMNTNVDAAKARAELSTEIMNIVIGKELGIPQPFNPNKTEVVLQNYQAKLDAARKIRMIEFTKDTYGVPRDQIGEFIAQAQRRVNFDRLNGLPPSRDDLMFSMMSTKDFRPLDGQIWKDVKPFYDIEGKKAYGQLDLWYPKQIADRVESRFWAPSRRTFPAVMAEYQKFKAMNMLTSPFRTGKQAVENFFKLVGLRVPPEDIFQEMAIAVGAKKDRIAKLADDLPSVSETVFNLSDFKDKIKVNAQMIADPDVNAGVNAFYGALHESAKKGNLERTLIPEAMRKGTAWLTGGSWNPLKVANQNALSRGIRHIGNYWDGLAKRAYFRKLIKQGYDAGEAAQMVGDHLMDFGSTTNLVRGMRYVSPFAAFQMKNLETLPLLMAMRPGVTNMINPYDGSLKRGIEEWSGWNPEDYKLVQKVLPYYRNPILGPILRGSKAIVANKDAALKTLNDYASWALGPEESKRLDPGLQLSLMMPTNVQAGLDFMDPKRANDNFASPMVASAAMYFLGYDLFKGKLLDTKGTPLEQRDKTVQALRLLNPLDYPKFYNKVVMPIVEKALPGFKARLEEGPITRDLAKILKLELGADAPLEKIKLSKDTLRAMTQMKFFGMGSLDDADFSFMTHQNALMRTLDVQDRLIGDKMTKEGRREALRVLGGLKNTIKEINENSKIYLDYKARRDAAGAYMDPSTMAELDQQMEHDEGATDLEQVPQTPTEAPQEEPGPWDSRQPQSLVEGGRGPASAADLMDRNSELTQRYLKPMDSGPSPEPSPEPTPDMRPEGEAPKKLRDLAPEDRPQRLFKPVGRGFWQEIDYDGETIGSPQLDPPNADNTMPVDEDGEPIIWNEKAQAWEPSRFVPADPEDPDNQEGQVWVRGSNPDEPDAGMWVDESQTTPEEREQAQKELEEGREKLNKIDIGPPVLWKPQARVSPKQKTKKA